MGQESLVLKENSQMDGAGIGVVGALAGVDNVVGRAELVFALLVAHTLQRQVGNHLIGSHIGAGAGAALNHIDGKLVVVAALYQLVAGPDDGFALLLGDHTNLDVGHSGGLLGHRHTLDEVVVVHQQAAADVEILHSACGLHAVICLLGHLVGAEQIALCAEFCIAHNRYFCYKNLFDSFIWLQTSSRFALQKY